MAESVNDECGICLDALANPVALPCSHKFCSKCLDSWRSKYGARGDREKVGRACPLCREKIPPSREMLMQLEVFRSAKKDMEAKGETLSREYAVFTSEIQRLEEEVGDWTEPLDHGKKTEEESLALPRSIVAAARNDDIQTILDWLGPPPVDKRLVNAKCAEWMNGTLVFYAAVSNNSNLLSILLQFGADVNAVTAMGASAIAFATDPGRFQQARLLLEWGAEIDPRHFGRTTKEEVVSFVFQNGNMKLANLLLSELGGRRCELINYIKSPELNGRTCVVEKYLPDKDRYKITFEGSGEKALVPPHNLKRRDRTPTDCGYYITFENGCFSRREFASKEECQAHVAEVEAKSAAEQLVGLNIGTHGSSRGRNDKTGEKKGRR